MNARRSRRGAVTGIVAGAAGLALVACGTSGGEAEPAAEEPAAEEPAAEEEDACAYLEGERLTIVVPYNPGGGFDNFVRLLAPELEKELEDTEIVVENAPGGGGLVGANQIFQAEPDGLTIGLINYPGAVFAEATDTEGVTFDNTEWTFLNRLGAINPIVYTGADSGLPTFESIMEAEEPVTFGIGGVGSDAYYATVVLSELLDFPADIIAGDPGGGEADAALLVGEVQAGVGSVDATMNRIAGTGTNITAIISTEPNEAVPDVPLITEFGDAEQQEVLTALASIYDLERTLVGPPGIDEARADCLAGAIYTAASAGPYEEAMETAGLTASPLTRTEVVERAETVNASIDRLVPYVTAGG